MLTPPELKGMAEKSGDCTVFVVTDFPFESTWAGSKVVVVAPGPLPVMTILMGIILTWTVVEEPVEGAVPTMLYL